MPPKRYLFATLFIAGMLMLAALMQAFKPARQGGVAPDASAISLSLDSFETLTDLRLEEGWTPRFTGTRDPDQEESWPPEGGFDTPWEPASPFLADQAIALNGPEGRSEVDLWKGIEWRHYRFDSPLVSARLDSAKQNRLLITMALGRGHFETRLLEIPEGRVLWAVDSGPWSRFSWDGQAVLLGFADPVQPGRMLVTALPVDGELPEKSLAPWDEDGLQRPPRRWATRLEQLWDDGKDLPGPKILIPWLKGDHLWMPRKDRLWVSTEGTWALWALKDGTWRRDAEGFGVLAAHPPSRMGLIALPAIGETESPRSVSPVDRADFQPVSTGLAPWPAYDPAWLWRKDAALTPWDLRWNEGESPLPKERQRESLQRAYRAEWQTASHLRPSVRGWLPKGPLVALRELYGVSWIWVGDRVLLVRLADTGRLNRLKGALG